MPSTVEVERSSLLPRDAATTWARVTSPEGIRHELRPVLGMTTPPRLRGRTIADVEPLLGQPLGKAWVLLLGVLPVELDDMRIVALEPGRRLHERSRMLLLPTWEHHREVVPVGGDRCEVRDRLVFVPRVAVLGPVARLLVGALFGHRHRRLRSWAAALR